MLGRIRNIIVLLGFLATTLSSCGDSRNYSEPLPDVVDFNFHIRPILVQNCYLCHGPDPSSRKADLRLDTYEGATAALEDGGYAIVPKKASKSLMISRINATEEDVVMPPPDSNLKLTERDKALLEKWIEQGAEWKEHWAFIKPVLAKSKEDFSIDGFINEALEQKGLESSPIADKNKLIRRLSYILTGLPPSPSDVQKFVGDTSEDAYEKLVDTYLSSPAYGERWARHWMDLVRYAETKGHEFDFAITGAWKYRDYLIRAFNTNVPYDVLLKEHLAGDIIKTKRYNNESGVMESPLGTAFYTFGEGSHSPVDVRQQEADRIDNMIDVTSKTFQGLTVSCAKCHDHKFDPITAADYYAFYGIMESTRFSPLIANFSKKDEQTLKEIQDLKAYMQQLVVDKWTASGELKDLAIVAEEDRPLKKDMDYSVIGDFSEADFDGWISNGLAFGSKTTLGNPLLTKSGMLNALSEGYASSKTLGTGVFGALRSPNFTIDSDYIGVRARGAHSVIRIVIDNFQLIQDPIYGDMEKGVNSEAWNNYTFNVASWKGHKAYVEILPGWFNKHDYRLPNDAFIEAKYAIGYNGEWPKEVQYKKGNFKNKANGMLTTTIVDRINRKLKQNKLPKRFPELKKALDSSAKLAAPLAQKSFFYGVNDGFGINSPVFNRGSYKEPSEEHVARRFLSALPKGNVPFMSQGSGRLDLANAMLDSENPLTARVMVNRIWHHLFGKGIVETVDNFGLQGKLPTHPELLDYLAIKFQKEGWSIKKMVREIVISDAFKRSTIRDERLQEKDPNNLYLASFPVRRLESEAIRDGILVATESLNDTMYGPPIATHLTKFMEGRGRPSKSGPMDGNGRRSIYQEVRRNFLDPMMTTFDRPMPFSTFGKRDVTNVPSQSLIILNDPFVAKQAEIMAKKLLQQSNLSFDKKVEWIYMRAFSRTPSEEEITKARTFISALEKMKKNAAEENELEKETMIWKNYCHSIFNLKEFIYLI